jgi:hypothetical protein
MQYLPTQARIQKKFGGREGESLQNLAIQIVPQHNKIIFSSLIENISGGFGVQSPAVYMLVPTVYSYAYPGLNIK